ncbi:amidohydrolase family protein [Labrys wisconsinensis]|uniref:Cytosine/adenosine deaminase-related metal-dependent hydrolase n=1 Tax=Labrys wisconsinensis TaxID=425677 RepID=A0ABU0J4P8_9HYPH|nr:amidohydrolase family protein [Labrys wisconsinensis]MDQ0469242.1 cytosine/adenosine deaminase-related metal-dependent hydrolase [Labrys wisconsinensis]
MTSPHAPFLIRTKALIRGVDASGAAEVVEDAVLHIVDGRIAAIGTVDLLARHPELPVEGGPQAVAIPGLVNAHHHFGLTPLMMGVPFAPLELWLPQFRGMRRIGHRLDTLYAAIEMLESGTTTVQHIQGGLSGPESAWDETVDGVVAAYGEIGMRVSWSFMIRDRNQLTYEDDAAFLADLPGEVAEHVRAELAASLAPIERHMAFFEAATVRWRARDPERVRLQLAPANLHWCSDTCLEAIFDTARRHGAKLHMHLVETERQADFARRRTGRSAIGHLAHLGCLGPDLTLGHGIWVDGADLDLLAEHRCLVCHNASSGLRLASGIAPVTEMTKRGIPVALGIDQSNIDDTRDMLTEMGLVWALHRGAGLWNERPSPAAVLRMATEHGAATTSFAGTIGRLDPGLAADIVLLDWDAVARPILDPRTPLADAVVLRAREKAVDTVFVGGRKLVEQGRVVSIDRDAVLREIADRLAAPPTPAEAQARAMVDRLMPHLEAWFRAWPENPAGRPYRYNGFAGP